MAQTPSHVSSPSAAPSALWSARRSASQASNSLRLACTSTDASMFACSRPQSSAHWPVYTPGSSASNHVSLTVPGDGVDLPAERGDPPGVDDVVVRCGHLERDRDAGGSAHRVDRDHAVRVLVLPVELASHDPDLEPLTLGSRGRHVLDARKLDEHERGDREQDDHGERRPGELELGRAVDRRALLEPGSAPAPVPDDEREQQALDEDEDRERRRSR